MPRLPIYTYDLTGIPYDQLTEEEKKSKPDIPMFLYDMLAPIPSERVTAPRRGDLKDSSEGKTFQGAALQAAHLVFRVCSEK